MKPDLDEALNKWGLALSWEAKTKTGLEADALWTSAGEKYAAALAIKPDKHWTLYNWGLALADQAATKTGAEAEALWEAAAEKFAERRQSSPTSM